MNESTMNYRQNFVDVALKSAYLFIFAFFILFLGGNDVESKMPQPKNIINAHHINIDPFSDSVEKWANHTKVDFNYDVLLGFWKVKNYYIAIFRKGDWIHICQVSDEPFVNRKSVSVVNIVDKDNKYIIDHERMKKEIEKKLQSRELIFYKKEYVLTVSRIIFDKKYFNKKVNVEISILKAPKVKDLKKIEPDLMANIIIN